MNPREKFTNKVDDYVKYRPNYPKELIDYLTNELGMSKDSTVADVGAGTGILTKLLADKVKTIYAVEPNLNMRTACEIYCADFKSFVAIDGGAEDTNLQDKSVDFITVAQAFHWFDREKTKVEFQRVLKPGGKVILVWNRKLYGTELVQENDRLCKRLCPEFKGFGGGFETRPENYSDFFKNGLCEYKIFDNDMTFYSLESFIGQALSHSALPSKGDANYQEFIDGMGEIFNKYSQKGILTMPSKTHGYIGEI